MATSAFPIHQRINTPIQFHGLKGQYILYAGAILAGDLVVFCLLYCCNVNSWICLLLAATAGIAGIKIVYRCSRQYGGSGLRKLQTRKCIPLVIHSRSRTPFTQLHNQSKQ